MAKKDARAGYLLPMLAFIIMLFIGLYVGSGYYDAGAARAVATVLHGDPSMRSIDNTGFIPATVSLDGSHLTIKSGCKAVGFDVTEDQAYSISRALDNVSAARPLTHDIFKDFAENFNITVLAVRIERFGDEIYYARMFVQQYDDMLDIDVRPSDAVALSLRFGKQLYINSTMLNDRGEDVC